MSTTIRPALTQDIEPICHLLHEKMNSKIPVSRWRNLMQYPWLEKKPDFGRVVESGGDILGFCGMVYSDRWIDIDNKPCQDRVVSMSSWYLDKSLRGQGLGRDMLLSAIKDDSMTYVTLTNSKKPLGIVEALGFQKLETLRYVWQLEDHQGDGAHLQDIELVRQVEDIYPQVDPLHHQMLEDMSAQPVTPILLQQGGLQALLFFSVKTKGDNVVWFDLMYASNTELFLQCAQALAQLLLPVPSSKLAADSRFIRRSSEGLTQEQLPVARYYISQSLEPHQIDNLYSELQLLDLKLD